jgi:hypothetical protein
VPLWTNRPVPLQPSGIVSWCFLLSEWNIPIIFTFGKRLFLPGQALHLIYQWKQRMFMKMPGPVKKISAGAITGTTAMTAFSYVATSKENKGLREPVLLGLLLKLALPKLSKNKTLAAGWLTHYGIGFLFAAIYHQLWERRILKPTVVNGMILGSVNGLIGIGLWKATLALHPRPPKIFYKKDYRHLLLAHLVFGMGTAIGYKKV